MHYLPDTNDEDAVGERYWPDSYKLVLREEIHRVFEPELNEVALSHVYKKSYSYGYPTIGEFVNSVIGGITIGAENGADAGFELIYAAFLSESGMPRVYRYSNLPWPQNPGFINMRRIRKAIAKDFRNDDGFIYAYEDGYKREFRSFDGFIDEVADIIVTEALNGVSDTLEKYYRAFFYGWPLAPMRRNPKRLKTW